MVFHSLFAGNSGSGIRKIIVDDKLDAGQDREPYYQFIHMLTWREYHELLQKGYRRLIEADFKLFLL